MERKKTFLRLSAVEQSKTLRQHPGDQELQNRIVPSWNRCKIKQNGSSARYKIRLFSTSDIFNGQPFRLPERFAEFAFANIAQITHPRKKVSGTVIDLE